jgi:predicted DNA-binding transcriptional regulator AlpA
MTELNLVIPHHSININFLCKMLSTSQATVWRRLKQNSEPRFPTPYKNGRSTLWDYQEVLAWLEACKAARSPK